MTIYIEIAISLILVFLVMSLLTTAITELLESFLGTRAKLLAEAIETLVSDPDIRDEINENPLLYCAIPKTANELDSPGTPSYICSKMFAKALLNAVANSGRAPSVDTPPPNLSPENIRASIELIENRQLRDTLLTLLSGTKDTVEDMEAAVSGWFDSAMMRLSGAFKRTQQWRSFAIGLVLAVTFNIDIVRLTDVMITDDVLRENLVLNALLFELPEEMPSGELLELIQSLTATASDYGLGWHQLPSGGMGWFTAVAGWTMAGFSVVLGAAFWFDLLQSFINVRSTGKKPTPEIKV